MIIVCKSISEALQCTITYRQCRATSDAEDRLVQAVTNIWPIHQLTVIRHGHVQLGKLMPSDRSQGILHKALLSNLDLAVMIQVSLMDDSGNNRDDLTLPKGTSDAEALAKQLKDDFDNGKELVVTVLKVCA